jgi:hypothetical protein
MGWLIRALKSLPKRQAAECNAAARREIFKKRSKLLKNCVRRKKNEQVSFALEGRKFMG